VESTILRPGREAVLFFDEPGKEGLCEILGLIPISNLCSD
jgi:hypothetical protein